MLINGSIQTKALLNVVGIIASIFFICMNQKHLCVAQQTWGKNIWLKIQASETDTKDTMFFIYLSSTRPSLLIVLSNIMAPAIAFHWQIQGFPVPEFASVCLDLYHSCLISLTSRCHPKNLHFNLVKNQHLFSPCTTLLSLLLLQSSSHFWLILFPCICIPNKSHCSFLYNISMY